MKRRAAIRALAAAISGGSIMDVKVLGGMSESLAATEPLPVLFVGHGNPMHAISDNDIVRTWRRIGASLPRPRAILCVSAHWETRGTFVTAMEKPRTIHDFGGFPRALYDVRYPAPGSPDIARETAAIPRTVPVELDHAWGLDHGCWSVLLHLFPDADIPVLQLSLDRSKSAKAHFDFAQELAGLRRKGIMIIGSGNLVHNLGMADWENPGGADWALEADGILKAHVRELDAKPLVNYTGLGKSVQLAIPTPEHYLPMLYALALADRRERPVFFNEVAELGSISMTSFTVGG